MRYKFLIVLNFFFLSLFSHPYPLITLSLVDNQVVAEVCQQQDFNGRDPFFNLVGLLAFMVNMKAHDDSIRSLHPNIFDQFQDELHSRFTIHLDEVNVLLDQVYLYKKDILYFLKRLIPSLKQSLDFNKNNKLFLGLDDRDKELQRWLSFYDKFYLNHRLDVGLLFIEESESPNPILSRKRSRSSTEELSSTEEVNSSDADLRKKPRKKRKKEKRKKKRRKLPSSTDSSC